MKAAFVALGVAALAGLAWNALAPKMQSNLLIENATAQPMGGMIGVELSINNQGAPDRLLSVSSASGMAMFHFPTQNKDLPIPVGTALLAMDAAHIMVSADDANLVEGALLPLTLTFENAGDVAIKARFAGGDMVGHEGHSMPLTDMDGPTPEISIASSPADPGWLITIETQHFTFAQDQADGPHVPGLGHGHIYAGNMKLGRVYGPSFRIGDLPKGTHDIRVTLNTNDHRAYMRGDTPISASTRIVVD